MAPALAAVAACEPGSRSFAALAGASTCVPRRWSHYTASSSASGPPGAAPQQRRGFSAGGPAQPWATKRASDAGEDSHKAGTPLKRASKPKSALHVDAKEAPPWQGASAERLSRELRAYQSDLKLAKPVMVRSRGP